MESDVFSVGNRVQIGELRGEHMGSQQEKANTLHRLTARLEALSSIDLLCDHLETLGRINNSARLLSGRAQDHSHHILEEAYAAYSQVATLLDEFYQELAYHRQCLQESPRTRSDPDEQG